jgi:hypothetical protein
MNAMEDAFRRVGIARGHQKPRLVLSSPAPTPTHKPIRERISEQQTEVEALSDAALELECIGLQENVEIIRADLQDPDAHEIGWKPRAERALAMLKGRLALCRRELQKRQHARNEQWQAVKRADTLLKQEAHAQFLAENQKKAEQREQAKEAARAEEQERRRHKEVTFIRCAKALLPAETFASIWAAVDAVREEEPA